MPPKPKSLGSVLSAAGISTLSRERAEPLWKGPEVDGITQSMLLSILGCPERAYLKYIEGLRTADTFKHAIEYGHMWHACEEALAAEEDWEEKLNLHVVELQKKYPLQQTDVLKWYNVCRIQFPVYVTYWKEHEDVVNRVPLMQEQVFNVPYNLDSGTQVILRGKFDSVDLIGGDGIYLQENKTKGDVDPLKIERQLKFDCQTMLYLIALRDMLNTPDEAFAADEFQFPVCGVRYNVIRRPLSGGKGTIKQLQGSKNRPAETEAEYYARLRDNYIVAEPESYFSRFKVEVSDHDLEVFEEQFLKPKLEQICEWYDWVTSGDRFRTGNRLHYRHPFGGYNVLDAGGSSDWDEYLETGNEVGLRRVDELFTELQ